MKKPRKTVSCVTCKHVSSDKIGEDKQAVYFCRFNPPQLTPIPGQSAFPLVKPDWRCGQHQST